MENETITIPKKRYEELILIEQESKEAISEITRGIKDWEEAGAEDSADFFEKNNL